MLQETLTRGGNSMALHACSGWGAHSNPPSLQVAEAGVVAAVGMPLVSTDVPVNATALRSYCCYRGVLQLE